MLSVQCLIRMSHLKYIKRTKTYVVSSSQYVTQELQMEHDIPHLSWKIRCQESGEFLFYHGWKRKQTFFLVSFCTYLLFCGTVTWMQILFFSKTMSLDSRVIKYDDTFTNIQKVKINTRNGQISTFTSCIALHCFFVLVFSFIFPNTFTKFVSLWPILSAVYNFNLKV